jgi:hypothetical protein
MPETEILSITIILNGLFLILLNGMFWKKTAGRRALWVCHLVVCLWFLVPFLVVSAIFETALLPLAYANKVELYPYAWMNTVAAWAVILHGRRIPVALARRRALAAVGKQQRRSPLGSIRVARRTRD